MRSLRSEQKYDKRFKCLYCGNMETKLARHLERKHSSEELVKRYLGHTIRGSKERKEAVALIRKQAHYEHNQDVLSKGMGTLLVERRSKEAKYCPEDFWACPSCLGFYHRKAIRIHLKACPSNTEHLGTKAVKVFYLAMTKPCTYDKFNEVLASMADDEVAKTVKSDPTIMKLGKQMYQSYEHTKASHVSTKMREVGRCLLALRNRLGHRTLTMREVILDVLMFDEVVKATKEVCKLQPGMKVKSIPSLALKIGHSVKKIIAIVMNESIRNGDTESRKNAKLYLQLHITEWSREISKYALDALTVKKKAKALPLTSDLQVIAN